MNGMCLSGATLKYMYPVGVPSPCLENSITEKSVLLYAKHTDSHTRSIRESDAQITDSQVLGSYYKIDCSAPLKGIRFGFQTTSADYILHRIRC